MGKPKVVVKRRSNRSRRKFYLVTERVLVSCWVKILKDVAIGGYHVAKEEELAWHGPNL